MVVEARFVRAAAVPAIYGPSGDVNWDEADPTCSVEAAKKGA
jgi:hypothetical protein